MFDYTKISDECIKCGKCKPTCTIFNINEDETTSPRGFIELLGAYKRGEIELDLNAKNIFESCFLCTHCVSACPNDLPTDFIIEQVRSEIAQKYGIAWYKKAFFFLLRHRLIMDLLAKFGYMFQTCGLKINKEKEYSTLKFDLPITKIPTKNRAFPFAKPKTFLNKYKKYHKFKKQKVAIFIGCMGNYAYTNIGDSLIKILNKLQVEFFIPKKQLCCGAPAYFTGDFDTVDYLVKKNIEYFESFIDEIDAIIVPEATCSAMIKIDWEHYLYNQPNWQKRAKKISKKIFMATQWLQNNTNLQELLKQKGKVFDEVVTYHDPCHARKMQGIFKEPRQLIKQNYEFIEMSDSSRCCGFGGVTMQSEKYEYALKAGLPKAQMIKNTNATIVSAECSACRMQITNSLYNANINNSLYYIDISLKGLI
jgi:glycolate oxidase iron-sulfur subunit